MEHLYDNIERYLLGELEGAELSAFEIALETDASLQKAVAQHGEMMQRLEGLRLRNKVRSTLSASGTVASSDFFRPRFWVSVLLFAVLVAMSWWFFQPAAQEAPLPETKTPPSTAPAPREMPQTLPEPSVAQERPQPIALAKNLQEQPSGAFIRDAAAKTHATPDPVQLAADAYRKKDFQRVVQVLGTAALSEQEEEALYLRANARFQLGQFATAASDFDALTQSFQFKYEARWNTLLCQVALGQADKIKPALLQMDADPDFPFRKKAQTLRRQLNF